MEIEVLKIKKKLKALFQQIDSDLTIDKILFLIVCEEKLKCIVLGELEGVITWKSIIPQNFKSN